MNTILDYVLAHPVVCGAICAGLILNGYHVWRHWPQPAIAEVIPLFSKEAS